MNIDEYIKNNEKLSKMDYGTVYSTIYELIKDGYIMEGVNEDVRTI